uniref:G-protein coupled receptors family 1 profile domain-containing protein n=1 Tax=Trichuris muris TaxID=70415 RepID=A0A5S6QMD3_TRIMR
MCSAINTAAIWIDVYIRRDEVVSASCYQTYVLSQWYHRTFYMILSITDFAAIGIQLSALVSIWIRKSKFSVVRLTQIRRQTAMLKESVMLVTCVILSQGIPNMYYVIETMVALPEWFHKAVWISSNVGYIAVRKLPGNFAKLEYLDKVASLI